MHKLFVLVLTLFALILTLMASTLTIILYDLYDIPRTKKPIINLGSSREEKRIYKSISSHVQKETPIQKPPIQKPPIHQKQIHRKQIRGHRHVKYNDIQPKLMSHIPIDDRNKPQSKLQSPSKLDVIDVVIPWVNYSNGYYENPHKPFDFGTPLYNIISSVGLKRPPWSEICWTVRSILYYGSDHINNIYIVYNAYRHGAPNCNFGDKVIPMPQQTFLKGTILEGLSSPRPHAVFPFLHLIPGLRDYFLFSMDDIFLLHHFDINTFYDFNLNKIITHMTGGIRGISAGSYKSNIVLKRVFRTTGSLSDGLHVPFLVHKRTQKNMMASLPSVFNKCSKPKHLCDFGIQYQTLIQNFMILSGKAYNTRANDVLNEIHTKENMNLAHMLRANKATWLNVQGMGVSDEYGGRETSRIRLRNEFDVWLSHQPFYKSIF